MLKFVLAATAAVTLAGVPMLANAEDAAHAAPVVAPAPAADPMEAAASAAAEAAADEVATVTETTLKDGTKVAIEGDMVSVVGADGAKTPAPDGEHELADGTKVKTMAGKIVAPEAPAAAH